MKTKIELQEITVMEFARMWGTNGAVPDSSKTMLLIADYEKERAEIAELKRMYALTSPASEETRYVQNRAEVTA